MSEEELWQRFCRINRDYEVKVGRDEQGWWVSVRDRAMAVPLAQYRGKVLKEAVIAMANDPQFAHCRPEPG